MMKLCWLDLYFSYLGKTYEEFQNHNEREYNETKHLFSNDKEWQQQQIDLFQSFLNMRGCYELPYFNEFFLNARSQKKI